MALAASLSLCAAIQGLADTVVNDHGVLSNLVLKMFRAKKRSKPLRKRMCKRM